MAGGLTARLAQVHEQRHTTELVASLGLAPGEDPWARRTTSTLPRGTRSLAAFGESRLDQIARELSLTDAELSRITGLPEVMLGRWKLGLLQPGEATVARYDRLARVHARLYATFQPSDVLWWLQAEQEALGFRSPVAAMCAGEFPRVEAALDRFA